MRRLLSIIGLFTTGKTRIFQRSEYAPARFLNAELINNNNNIATISNAELTFRWSCVVITGQSCVYIKKGKLFLNSISSTQIARVSVTLCKAKRASGAIA